MNSEQFDWIEVIKKLEKLSAPEIRKILSQYKVKELRRIADRLYKKGLNKSQLIDNIVTGVLNKKMYRQLMISDDENVRITVQKEVEDVEALILSS